MVAKGKELIRVRWIAASRASVTESEWGPSSEAGTSSVNCTALARRSAAHVAVFTHKRSDSAIAAQVELVERTSVR